MRFLDKQAEASFTDQEDGSTIFYPCGRVVSGRIITCERRKMEVFEVHRRIILAELLAATVFGIVVALLSLQLIFVVGITAVACIPAVGFQIYFNHRVVADLPKTDIKMNITNSRAKSVRCLPLIFWKADIVFGVCLTMLTLTIRVWFSHLLKPYQRTVINTILLFLICLFFILWGWYGYQLYKIEEPTLKFRETHELKDINCEDEKHALIIKEQSDPSDRLDSEISSRA